MFSRGFKIIIVVVVVVVIIIIIIIIIRQPLCPVVVRRPQHAVSKLPSCAFLCHIVSLQYLSRSPPLVTLYQKQLFSRSFQALKINFKIQGIQGPLRTLLTLHSHAYLVSLAQTEGDFACIVHRLTDESVAAREQQRLLDTDGLITDHIHHKLHVLRVSDLPATKWPSYRHSLLYIHTSNKM